jgi:hypothetical protein
LLRLEFSIAVFCSASKKKKAGEKPSKQISDGFKGMISCPDVDFKS